MKILTVIGARPQFIKAAAVSRVFKQSEIVNEIIAHTGQHFDPGMSDVFFEEMDIPRPNYFLDVNNLPHGAMTGRMLEKLESVMVDENPDAVLVYGDTNSTLAGALSASKLHIPIMHVEAGLRSFNLKMPEEINRILTDRISTTLFCPTENAVSNLQNEGYSLFPSEIVLSGDVMEDSALYYSKKPDDISKILDLLNLESTRFILCTVHRQENTDSDDKLKSLVETLNIINDGVKVVMPLHPRTLKKIESLNLSLKFMVIPPVGYFDMIQLIKNSLLVITDSGGLQKEAYFFNKFCITLREETEWIELVKSGYNKVVGLQQDSILDALNKFKNESFVKTKSLYGGGNASSVIYNHIISKIK